jgi:hypothetical protein
MHYRLTQRQQVRFYYLVTLPVMRSSNRSEVRNSSFAPASSRSADYRDLCWQLKEGADYREDDSRWHMGRFLKHNPSRLGEIACGGNIVFGDFERSFLVTCGERREVLVICNEPVLALPCPV